jgi:hypothetical protein
MPAAVGMRVLPDGTIQKLGPLQLAASDLRPRCRAGEVIFRWRGPNRPQHTALGIPILQHISDLASRSSLRDAGGCGSGVRKFHIFLDVFGVPEVARLPASKELVHAFALWAACTPDPNDPMFADGTLFEPVSVTMAKKYVSAIQTWHLAQGYDPPFDKNDFTRLKFAMHGLNNIKQNCRTCPPCPPITLRMLDALHKLLDLNDTYDACIWAISTCTFWGMMRFGEVTVKSRAAFNGSLHLKHSDLLVDSDTHG